MELLLTIATKALPSSFTRNSWLLGGVLVLRSMEDNSSKGRRLRGFQMEMHVQQELQKRGYKVEKMKSTHSFDLLVENRYKVEVKSCLFRGTRRWYFSNINRTDFADIFALVFIWPDRKEIKYMDSNTAINICNKSRALLNVAIHVWEDDPPLMYDEISDVINAVDK